MLVSGSNIAKNRLGRLNSVCL